MLNWLVKFFNYESDNNDNEEMSLHKRMKKLVSKWNSYKIHPYKPTVVNLTSHDLLKFVNSLTSYEDKILFFNKWNSVYKNVCEKLYNKFGPSMIYYFNDEINIVFYHNDYGEVWGNGNLHKLISSISSYASSLLKSELYKNEIDLDFCFNCKLVQFDDKYETLNWMVWRQSDCRKNTIALLYKCYHLNFTERGGSLYLNEILNAKVNGVKTINLENYLYENVDNVQELKKLILGNILKKQICVISNDPGELYSRKEIVLFNTNLKSDFLDNFSLFIKQKYLV